MTSTPHALRRLTGRLAILAIPGLLWLAAYGALDPFGVVWRHGDYCCTHGVQYNRDFVSTERYLRHPRRDSLDAFIFGSSRSDVYHASDWAPHIHSTRIFHFNAFGESLYGVQTKLRWLDRHGARLRHVLIVADTGMLATVADQPGHLYMKDPRTSGESALAFHGAFLHAFATPKFLLAYADYRLFHTFRHYMTGYISPGDVGFDARSNERYQLSMDRAIRDRGDAYFVELAHEHPRPPTAPHPAPPVIGPVQRRMLLDIARVLARQHADYRIVISALYDEVPLNPADLSALRTIFGPANVFDFSGANPITRDVHNYYEQSHYRPGVAREILRAIYDG
ncbi:hypothetical protein J421_1700 [Gemmatirosa kalamazoonensis]|uniref:Uncharacterized protein n=1 Tax=Gemmatirosa kalamazoonensis TaxID=861299 RepID=W0RFP5_9BACT|nr:hypothetical protein [Gemmatirosa kalamazoonensis]AHG89237.1 hypothetical protein J421_1700 [Gemmatirosa kalamazoonensis]